jgi:small GTP-binding protein
MQRLPGQDVAQFKVPLVGDTSVGKTSIVGRYTSASFAGNTSPTVGVSTANLSLTVRNEKVELSVWDTAGQEKFRSLVPLYTRQAALIVLVFDISSRASFDGAEAWLDKVRNEMGVRCPIFLCANKIDLAPIVSREIITEWGKDHECQVFFTSAVTGDGVSELFQEIANTLATAGRGVGTVTAGQNLQAASKQKCC